MNCFLKWLSCIIYLCAIIPVNQSNTYQIPLRLRKYAEFCVRLYSLDLKCYIHQERSRPDIHGQLKIGSKCTGLSYVYMTPLPCPKEGCRNLHHSDSMNLTGSVPCGSMVCLDDFSACKVKEKHPVVEEKPLPPVDPLPTPKPSKEKEKDSNSTSGWPFVSIPVVVVLAVVVVALIYKRQPRPYKPVEHSQINEHEIEELQVVPGTGERYARIKNSRDEDDAKSNGNTPSAPPEPNYMYENPSVSSYSTAPNTRCNSSIAVNIDIHSPPSTDQSDMTPSPSSSGPSVSPSIPQPSTSKDQSRSIVPKRGTVDSARLDTTRGLQAKSDLPPSGSIPPENSDALTLPDDESNIKIKFGECSEEKPLARPEDYAPGSIDQEILSPQPILSEDEGGDQPDQQPTEEEYGAVGGGQ